MALMTVAGMPMWSAATRSISMAAAATPRKKFPPPTTRPIWTPVPATSAISAARLFTRSGSTPKAPPPASASPLSLRTMRVYLGIVAQTNQLTDLAGESACPTGSAEVGQALSPANPNLTHRVFITEAHGNTSTVAPQKLTYRTATVRESVLRTFIRSAETGPPFPQSEPLHLP